MFLKLWPRSIHFCIPILLLNMQLLPSLECRNWSAKIPSIILYKLYTFTVRGTCKLDPKEKGWKILQRAVRFQISWNFVIKKKLHFTKQDSILKWTKINLKYSTPSLSLILAAFAWYLIWPVDSPPCSPPFASRTLCWPTSSWQRRSRYPSLIELYSHPLLPLPSF